MASKLAEKCSDFINWFKQYLFNNTLINRATPYVKIAVVHVCTVHLVHTR